MRDLRYAVRSLARTPAFTATAVLILTLSVGAATAVFTLLYALVLGPLPIANAHELARVSTIDLINTSPHDPIAIGLACLLLFAMTSAVSVIPAIRAGRVEPLAELRRD